MVRRTSLILPGFTAFVCVRMVVDIAEFTAAALYHALYYRYWMFLDPLTWIFEIWACVEVADRLFDSVSRQPDQRFRRWTMRAIWMIASAVGLAAMFLSIEPSPSPNALVRNFAIITDLKRCYVLVLFVATLIILALFRAIRSHTARLGSCIIAPGMLTHATLLTIFFALQTVAFWTVQATGNHLGVRRTMDVIMTVGTCTVFLLWARLMPDSLRPPEIVRSDDEVDAMRADDLALKQEVRRIGDLYRETLRRLGRGQPPPNGPAH